jgi:hypothetical protein
VESDLIAPETRRWRAGRREMPYRFLLDGGLFRLLCDAEQADRLESFRASLAHLRLAPKGGLPDLEMTPLAILDALGVEPPRFPAIPNLPKSLATLEDVEVGIVLLQTIRKEFEKAPELEPASLRRRADELRQATNPAAHDLFDLCLTRFVSRDKFEQGILAQLAFDALLTFRFAEEYRMWMAHLFNSFLLSSDRQISGLTKVRRLRLFWDESLERILKRNPKHRSEILAVDQEMKPRAYKDFLGWEVIHLAILGFARTRVHPVIAFSPEPEDRLRARCKAHKTALRAFLDEIPRSELAGELRHHLRAWAPGWLVACQGDGRVEGVVETAAVEVWAAG